MAIGVGAPSKATPTTYPAERDADRWLPRLSERLDRPLSTRGCVLGWLLATGLFVGLIVLFGGPTPDDSLLSTASTWAIAHGDIACSYPPLNAAPTFRVAPLYPLLSGAIAAVSGIGHQTPFPSQAAMGPQCHNAATVMSAWSHRAKALTPTTWIGCVCWLPLMAGIVAWLRAAGRGRSWWEPATILMAAALLPTWMSVQTFFHPQDLLALGLALWSLSYARRDRWLLAGGLCALAILSQQFALLVALPLFIVAPAKRKAPFLGATVVVSGIVVLPLAVLTSGHVIHAVAIGTGNNLLPGGTVLWYTHANGAAGVLLFRIAPLAVSAALAWWLVRRLGPDALQPVPLLGLVAVSLCLRLVFEADLYAYYFVAIAVCLVLLDATRGAIRRSVVAWLGALVVVICRETSKPFGETTAGLYVQLHVLPLLIACAALGALLWHLRQRGDRKAAWPWAGLALVAFLALAPGTRFDPANVVWFWQVLLVVPALFLAAEPLWRVLGRPERQDLPAVLTAGS